MSHALTRCPHNRGKATLHLPGFGVKKKMTQLVGDYKPLLTFVGNCAIDGDYGCIACSNNSTIHAF